MKTNKILFLLVLLIVLIIGLASPWLFVHIATWQKTFNQLITDYFHHIQDAPLQAGFSLVVASFLYGVLHALGPGHGKFIIASYLSTHESQLKTTTILSLLSSFMQGIVAISATTLLVVVLNVSSRYFKLSQLWLERGALSLLILLGIYWIWQGVRAWRNTPQFKIRSLQKFDLSSQSAVKNTRTFTQQTCNCRHQHLPSATQTQQATNLKSQCLIILTIGMRPCSGAIFVLFLAYMLDLYLWGMLAVLTMSFGTGITLSAFAALVRYARNTAIHLGRWYQHNQMKGKGESLLKLLAGAIIIFFALSLLYSTTLSVRGGAVLIGG